VFIGSSHFSAGIRKMALQALTTFAKLWVPTAEQAAAGVPEPVPGFRRFAAETVAAECCVRAVLRGDLVWGVYSPFVFKFQRRACCVCVCVCDARINEGVHGVKMSPYYLDPRDAGCAAAVAEAVNFQRVMLERCGDDFARHLVGGGAVQLESS
jgi:hypothetical protein